MAKCLIVFEANDVDVSTKDAIEKWMAAYSHEAVRSLVAAQAGHAKGRDCTISGTASGGSGGASGSVTISCRI